MRVMDSAIKELFDKGVISGRSAEKLAGVAAEIAEDEEKLFDRSRNRFCTIEEHESQLVAAA